MEYKKVNPNIFNYITYDFSPYTELSNDEFNIICLTTFGKRPIAPILEIFVENDKISEFNLEKIGSIITKKFKDKWTKLGNLLLLEYDPITTYSNITNETIEKESMENIVGSGVDVSELNSNNNQTNNLTNNLVQLNSGTTLLENDITNNLSQLTTNNLEQINTGTSKTESLVTNNLESKTTNDLQEITNNDLTETVNANQENNLYGFNSSIAVGDTTNSGISNKNNTGTVTINNTGDSIVTNDDTTNTDTTVTNNLSEVNKGIIKVDNTGTINDKTLTTNNLTQQNTGTQNRILTQDYKSENDAIHTNVKDSNNNENITRETLRKGNLGNIPFQNLIKEEIGLWQWNFIEQVIDDVKNFLTLPIYYNHKKHIRLIDGESY